MCGVIFYSALAVYGQTPQQSPAVPSARPKVETTKQDTVRARYPVAKTSVENYNDLLASPPMDLRTPDNVKSEVRYDVPTNSYLFVTKVDGQEVSTPYSLNANEYINYWQRKSTSAYFKSKIINKPMMNP